eukprot:3263231-Heterocapsa_arctica.AAC.1
MHTLPQLLARVRVKSRCRSLGLKKKSLQMPDMWTPVRPVFWSLTAVGLCRPIAASRPATPSTVPQTCGRLVPEKSMTST